MSKTAFDDFPAIGGLMVSKMVAVDKMKPRFMYREKRTRPEDSGWRIFSGFEDQEYTDNPKNTAIYNPTTIIAIDPSIANLLLKGVGSVFERASDNSDWYAVTDFEFEDDYLTTLPLTGQWIIKINNLFEQEEQGDGDQFFTTGDKSVRVAIRHSSASRMKLLEEHQQLIANRDDSESKTHEVFDLSDSEYIRIGYSTKESDEWKEYDVIYGFTIVDHEVVQLVIYYDDEKDKDWALETWKSIRKDRP